MRITIDIDTSAPLSDKDVALIELLTRNESTVASEPEVVATTKAPATRTIDKIAAAKAAEAKAKAEAALAVAAAEAAADADEAAEDLVGGAEPTLQDAVDKAIELVGKGQQALVKRALTAAGGAKRVSELKGASIGQFLAALDA